MLKGIPKILSPELLMVLSEMGHGDRVVIADGNFPAESVGRDAIVIRADGHGALELLKAILQLVPLDTFVETPVALMQTGDGVPAPIWWEYIEAVAEEDERGESAFEYIERFDFYGEASEAYAIIATGESALYANIILQKGVI
jgi:L-fucose mutarotase